MGIITAINAAVDGIESSRDCRLLDESMVPGAVPSGSDGAFVRADGNEDWGGVLSAYGHTPLKMPGEKFAFQCATREGKGFSGNAIGRRAIIVIDVRNGLYIYYHLFFQGNGALTAGDYTVTDTSIPNLLSAKSRGLKLDSTAEDHISYMRLVLDCYNAEYVDNSTAGWVMREKGNMDANFMYRRNVDDMTLLPAKHSIKQVDFEVTSSLTWTMNWGIMGNRKPIYDNEGGERKKAKIVAAEVEGKFTGFKDGTTKGTITNPAGTAWWP